MRQVVVLHVLIWLGANNILYKDVIINHEEMANWKDKFLLRSVEDNIVLSLSDYSEHEGFMYNFH